MLSCNVKKTSRSVVYGVSKPHFSDHNQHAIPQFSDAGIIPLQFSYYELAANVIFDIRRRNAPRNIGDLFEDISNIHSYNTRSSALNNF